MAYDVLSDPDKRSVYDLAGEEGIKGGRSAQEETGNYSESDNDSMSDSEEDEEEISFTSFFGHHTPFEYSGINGGSFSFSFSSARTSYGSSHGYHDYSESESESEPEMVDNHSDNDTDEDSGVYSDQRHR